MKLKIFLTLALVAFVAETAPAKSSIPARPEQLKFPELNFQPPDAAQYRVQLQSGPVAYVIPDRELPLVNLSILVRTGDYTEPAGKEGLATLAGQLLRLGGTTRLTAEQLDEQLAFLAANLGASVDSTMGNVSLNLLSKDLDEGLGLLREVLTAPRFQEDKIRLRQDQVMQELRQRNDDSSSIESREVGNLAYGEKFWSNQDITAKSLGSITRDDMVQFHRRWYHPANFVVAVSGDFEREAMIAKLEKLFADWPFRGEVPPPIPTNTHMAAPGVYLVNKDVNQGRVSILLPGLMRDDPDYFAAAVMNDILGGGGFTSRIMNRVRTEEGLAYSAGSALAGGVYYPPPFIASFQTKSRTVPYAISLVLGELQRMGAETVTDTEIQTSTSGMIERFPRAFASKAQIAGLFASEEFTGRYAKDPDYWKKYRDRIRAVTKADIQRVAKRLLTPDKAVIALVGQRDEILLGHPNHPQRLHDFGGQVTELPLRDPMTLAPQGSPKTLSPNGANAGGDESGWAPIFDGKTFAGWKPSTENSGTWKIEEGAFVTRGERSHLFYVGDERPLKNFELKVDVMTEKNSNGGIYFHTKYQEEGWPRIGFETQVNNTHSDWKKTGSLYDVVNVRESAAKDNQWWTQHVIVKGNQVTVKVDGKTVMEYTEPADQKPGAQFTRKLDQGTIAFQAHDPGSVVRYKNVRVKRLD